MCNYSSLNTQMKLNQKHYKVHKIKKLWRIIVNSQRKKTMEYPWIPCLCAGSYLTTAFLQLMMESTLEVHFVFKTLFFFFTSPVVEIQTQDFLLDPCSTLNLSPGFVFIKGSNSTTWKRLTKTTCHQRAKVSKCKKRRVACSLKL